MFRRCVGSGLVAMVVAGCGGGGGSEEAVLANPQAPPPAMPSPAPDPQPDPVDSPVPQPPSAPPPDAGPPAIDGPKASSVAGEIVWAALQHGVLPHPQPSNPSSKDRPIYTEDLLYRYFIGGSLVSYRLVQVPSRSNSLQGFAIVAADVLDVQMVGSDGVIDWVVANDVMLTGPQLDLRHVDPVLDKTVATWRHGEWFINLIVQSDQLGDVMRVCWDAFLPPPPPVRSDDPNFIPFVRTFPLKRLMCALYEKAKVGPDVGGYVVDDYDGDVLTFRGTW